MSATKFHTQLFGIRPRIIQQKNVVLQEENYEVWMIICTVMPSCMNFLIPRCFQYELSILFFVTVRIKRRSVYKSLMKQQLMLMVSKEKLCFHSSVDTGKYGHRHSRVSTTRFSLSYSVAWYCVYYLLVTVELIWTTALLLAETTKVFNTTDMFRPSWAITKKSHNIFRETSI